MAKFVVGQKVMKILHGIDGYTEEEIRTVYEVTDGVVYLHEYEEQLGSREEGITYDAKTGHELENFFPPMYAEIVPHPIAEGDSDG